MNYTFVYIAGQRLLHAVPSEEGSCRSDRVLVDVESFQTHPRTSSWRQDYSRYILYIHHPVQRGRASDCPRHERDGRP